VPAGIASLEGLFQALYNALNLPGYFGFNWNALSDCLRDFHWVLNHGVVIYHKDLPNLGCQDICLYLRILNEAKVDWESSEEHSLRVVFPVRVKEEISKLNCK